MNLYMTHNDHPLKKGISQPPRTIHINACRQQWEKTSCMNNSNTSLPTSITRLRVSFSACDTRMKVLAKKIAPTYQRLSVLPFNIAEVGAKGLSFANAFVDNHRTKKHCVHLTI